MVCLSHLKFNSRTEISIHLILLGIPVAIRDLKLSTLYGFYIGPWTLCQAYVDGP